MGKYGILFVFFLLMSCKINQRKDGLPIGKWVYISKEGNNISRTAGRYNKHGFEKGIWRFYYNDTLYRKEKYRGKICKNTLYYQNGSIAEEGFSTQDTLKNGVYWKKTGNWYLYDKTGKLMEIKTYEQ